MENGYGIWNKGRDLSEDLGVDGRINIK